MNSIEEIIRNLEEVPLDVLADNITFILMEAERRQDATIFKTAMDRLGWHPSSEHQTRVYQGDFSGELISEPCTMGTTEAPQVVDYIGTILPRRTYSPRSIKKGTDAYAWLKEFYEKNPEIPKPEGGLSKLSAREKVELVREILQKRSKR